MKRLLLLGSFCATVLLSSCGKDETTPTPTPTPTPAATWFPLTKGSSWNYSGGMGGSYSLKVADSTLNANGFVYFIMLNSLQSTPYYLRKSGNDVLRYDPYSQYKFANKEWLIYKDNAALNSSWTVSAVDTVSGDSIQYTYTVKAVDGSKMIGSTNYTGVVTLEAKTQTQVSGNWAPANTRNIFYAKGVGMIAIEGVPSFNNVSLTSYTIK